MRYLFGFALGLLAGVAAAAAVIFFNPLTRLQSLPDKDAGWVLDFSLGPTTTWIWWPRSAIRRSTPNSM